MIATIGRIDQMHANGRVETLTPLTDRVHKRFGINSFCIVADRSMISAETIKKLEDQHIVHIFGTRMVLQIIRTSILDVFLY